MSALWYAIRGYKLEAVKFLVEKCGADIEHRDAIGKTPFYWSCQLKEEMGE